MPCAECRERPVEPTGSEAGNPPETRKAPSEPCGPLGTFLPVSGTPTRGRGPSQGRECLATLPSPKPPKRSQASHCPLRPKPPGFSGLAGEPKLSCEAAPRSRPKPFPALPAGLNSDRSRRPVRRPTFPSRPKPVRSSWSPSSSGTGVPSLSGSGVGPKPSPGWLPPGCPIGRRYVPRLPSGRCSRPLPTGRRSRFRNRHLGRTPSGERHVTTPATAGASDGTG